MTLAAVALLSPMGCAEPSAGDTTSAEQAQRVAVGAPEVTVRARPPEVIRLPDPAVVEPSVPGEREQFGGVGLVLSRQEEGLFVLEVVPGTAAEVAGIQPGDRIASVDGQPVGYDLEQIVGSLRGEPGTVVAVETIRPAGQTATLRLERGLITFEAEEDHGSEYGGVGLTLTYDHSDGFYVMEVRPGHGAARAGIRQGDHIYAVAGQPVARLPIEAVTNLLRGEPGTTVEVQVVSDGDSAPRTVRVERERVVIEE